MTSARPVSTTQLDRLPVGAGYAVHSVFIVFHECGQSLDLIWRPPWVLHTAESHALEIGECTIQALEPTSWEILWSDFLSKSDALIHVYWNHRPQKDSVDSFRESEEKMELDEMAVRKVDAGQDRSEHIRNALNAFVAEALMNPHLQSL